MLYHTSAPTRLENTKVLSGPENTIRVSLEAFARVRDRHDTCSDSTLPSTIFATEPIKNAYLALKERGVKTRFITDITRQNLSQCKELLRIVSELRHLEGVKGNFAVGEDDYMATASQPESGPLPSIIHSNVKAVIEQQSYIFETLWKKAIPADKRIKEIEEGVKPEVIETIEDPKEVVARMYELLKSARNEVLVIFATSNAFRRQQSSGLSYLIANAMRNQPLKVRIMTPADKDIVPAVDSLKKQWEGRLDIRFIEKSAQIKVSVLVVDRSLSLAAELRDDSKDSSVEAIGLSTYSNSEPTVLSYVSMFEALWDQTDLYQHVSEINAQLSNANAILQNNDQLQKDFINIAAHELRTPIQPILGLSQMLRETPDISSRNELLDTIIRNAKRLDMLATDILKVSRIESNLLKLDYSRFDLIRLVLDVIKDIKQDSNSNLDAQTIRFSTRANKIEVQGDREKLGEVISNLVSNALKFTGSGTITISAKKTQGEVTVSVKDSGTGIYPSILPKLFTKFASKSDGGTGLGLYICKNIVEAHGGKIWAKNNTGSKGATFWFSIPASPK